MAEQAIEREPRRDPGEPLPEQAPGAGRRHPVEDDLAPTPMEVEGRVAGSSEDFTPRTTTDIAQHAPGPHGQGDEPTSAVEGRFDYDDDQTPEVSSTPRRNR
jgi:hypothetical protein